MDNLLTCSTNLYALFPIFKAIDQNKYLLAGVLTCSCISSMIYHSLEHERHNLTGLWPAYRKYEKTALNVDSLFAVLSVVMVLHGQGWKLLQNPNFYLGPYSLIYLALSEIVFKKNKFMYLITHNIWHVLAFYTAWLWI